jgi:hypothetical protein
MDDDEELWIDVSKWSGLSGAMQPFMDVKCNTPEAVPGGTDEWRDWARAHLCQVAEQDDWQSGRYHYTVESRDPAGRALDTFTQAFWDWDRGHPGSPRALPH